MESHWSEDGAYWWDGRAWQQASPDKTQWWDGTEWRPIADSAEDDKKRRAIRRYFAKEPNRAWPIAVMAVGLLLVLPDASRAVGALALLAGLAWLVVPMIRTSALPDDQTIDMWLNQDIASLRQRALQRLNLDPQELKSEPLFIVGPILWQAPGVPPAEIRWKKGKDGRVRFSISSVTVLHLIEHKVSSFQCAYNFIRGVGLNERDDEYYYRDIVAVSTREESTNYQLPNRSVMRWAQAFTMSVASGERISVIVSSAELLRLTGGKTIADSGADKAIKALRKVLGEKKLP